MCFYCIATEVKMSVSEPKVCVNVCFQEEKGSQVAKLVWNQELGWYMMCVSGV